MSANSNTDHSSLTVSSPGGDQFVVVAIQNGPTGRLLTMLSGDGSTFSAYENQMREQGWSVDA